MSILGGGRRRAIAVIATAGAAVALAVVVTGRGCGDGDGTPEGAARAFVSAARDGDRDATWELLGPATKQRLIEAAEGATNRVGGTRRYGALDMLEVGSGDANYAPTEILLRERVGSTAVVDVLGPSGRRDTLSLVKVGKKWRVELPAPAASPPRP